MKTKEYFVAVFVFLTLICLFFVSASPAYLSYDKVKDEVLFSYDNIDRLIIKNATSDQFTYSYDGEINGTLTNVSSGDIIVSFEYDVSHRKVV